MDDLDENYELDENFSTKYEHQSNIDTDNEENEIPVVEEAPSENNKKPIKRKFDQVTRNEKSNTNALNDVSKKKNKKKNITEMLALKKSEIEQPTYAINEFKKILIKYSNVNLSSVEKNELNLSEVSLTGEPVESVDEKLEKIILKRNKLSHLPFDEQFNQKFNDKLQVYLKKPSVKQSPFIIVLCSSAMRCIEIQTKLDTSNELIKQKKVRWMHAFAKHKKLPLQIDQIKKLKTPINIVYATPQRLVQLVEADALRLTELKYLVVDYTHRDVKQKRFMDMVEMKEEFLKFCFGTLLKLNKNTTQVKFYLA